MRCGCVTEVLSDAETRTIIDKLAEFVARNGFEFENITKKKQLTNPKFAFLYGGEHYNYYKHRVCMEQRCKWREGRRGRNQGNKREFLFFSAWPAVPAAGSMPFESGPSDEQPDEPTAQHGHQWTGHGWQSE